MKFKLLLLLSVFSLISCSGDDVGTGSSEKELKSTVTNFYFNGAISGRAENNFEGNKLTESILYNGNSFNGKNVYEYGSDGQLSVLKVYDMFNNITGTISYDYDSNGRLTQSVMAVTDGFSQTTSFAYNNDNTITKTNTSAGNIMYQHVYHINNAGKIYKITNGADVVQEVEYAGNNIIWWNNGSDIIDLVYDSEHEVKGEFLNTSANLMSLSQHNNILSNGFTALISGKDNYVIRQLSTLNTNDQIFEFDFDADGYPVKKRIYLNGETQPSTEIIINYR